MINPAELARRPFRERDLLPVANDEQVIQHFQARIEKMREEVRSMPGPGSRIVNLFHMSGEEEYSLIGNNNSDLDNQRVERGRGQVLLFKVMSEYGFNQDNGHPRLRYNVDKKRREKDITRRPDGTTREVHVFPSKTINGIEFERVQSFITETGQTTDVWWKAAGSR